MVRCKAPKAEDGDTAPEINNWGAKYDGDAVNDGGAVNGGEYANGVDFVDTTANDEWGSTAETGAW